MNKNSIKQLLSKGKLTGKEIGRLFVLNTIAEITGFKKTKQLTPIMTQAELDNAVNSKRSDSYQLGMYNYYIDIQNLATHLFRLSATCGQMIEAGYNKLLLGVSIDLWNIDKDDCKANLPLIMTEEKYKEEQQAFKEGEASYYDLFFIALWYYAGEFDNKDNTIKNLLSKVYADYEDQPVKDKTLIDLYKKRFLHTDFCRYEGYGYYTLSDNRSCEEVNLKEYTDDFFNRPLFKGIKNSEKQAILDSFYNETKQASNLFGQIDEITDAEGETHDAYKHLQEVADLRSPDSKAETIRVFEFIDALRKHFTLQEDTEDFIEELDQLEADSFNLTYTVDKQDLIIDSNFISYLYKDDEDNAEVLELYLKELPELEKILYKDITEKLGLKEIDYFETDKKKKTKKVNYNKPIAEWEDIFNKNIYNLQNNIFYFRRQNREAGTEKGVAIMQDRVMSETFKEEHFKEGIYNYTSYYDKHIGQLRDIMSKNRGSNKEVVEENIEYGFKNIYAINALLEDLEDIYNLTGLKDAYTACNVESKEAYIQIYNFFKFELTAMAGDKLSNPMLLKLSEDINYINLNDYKPSKETRERAKQYLSDIKVLENAGRRVNKLLSLYFEPDTEKTRA